MKVTGAKKRSATSTGETTSRGATKGGFVSAEAGINEVSTIAIGEGGEIVTMVTLGNVVASCMTELRIDNLGGAGGEN